MPTKLSQLPSPPKGQVGRTLDELSKLPAPPQNQQGMSLEQAQNQLKQTTPAKPGSIIDSIFNAATQFVDFLGGKHVADTFGTEIARIGKSPQDQANIEAMAPTVAQTTGSALQLGSLFAPVGAEAKILSKGAQAVGVGPKVAKVIGNVGVGAATGFGLDVGQNLADGKTGTDVLTPGGITAVGAAIPLAGPVIKGATRLGAEALGVTTGTGYGAIKELFNASAKGGAAAETARNALRGNTTPEQIVQEAKGALDQIKSSRSQVYQNSLAKLKESKQTFDITPVIDSVATNLEKFGIRVGQQGEIDFSRSPLRFNSAAQTDITQIVNTMKDFGSNKGDRTVIGLDSLKRAFSDLYTPSGEARAFVQSVKSSVRDILGQVPGYDAMSTNYEEKTHLINDIQKSLSLGDKASIDTAFKKLTTVLRTNNEERRVLVEELNAVSGGKLVPMIAGQQMGEILPRGIARQIEGFGALGTILAGFGAPLLKMAVFASPRVVGELVNALGIGARASKYLMDVLGTKSAQFPGDSLLKIGNKSSSLKPKVNGYSGPMTANKPVSMVSPSKETKPIAGNSITANFKNKGGTTVGTLSAVASGGALSAALLANASKSEARFKKK